MVAAILIVILIALVTSGEPSTRVSPAPSVTMLAPDVVAQCEALIIKGHKAGIVKARPKPSRIDVEDSTWEQMSAETKRILLQAVSCTTYGVSVPTALDSVVAYGHRSGKRLAMLTAAGVEFE